VADGAFIASTDPRTGETRLSRTPVADYQQGLTQARFDNQVGLARLAGDFAGARQQSQQSFDARMTQLKIDAESADADKACDARYELARMQIDARRAAASANRPVPPSAMKQYIEQNDVASQSNQVLSQLDGIERMLSSGQLQLGALSNARQKASLAGFLPSNELTPLYGEYQQFLTRMANVSLLAAKGTQTEGDAERARAAIVSGNGDNASVLANLRVVREVLRRQADQASQNASTINRTYGIEGNHEASPGRAINSGGVTSTGHRFTVLPRR